jgi:hypothetical protein
MVDVPKILIPELSTDPTPSLAGIVLPQSRGGRTWKVTGDQLADLVNGKLAEASAATSGVSTLIGVDGSGGIVRAFATFQSAKGQNAVGDGVATENTALTALLASSRKLFIDSGTYKVTPEINITEQDYHIVVDPRAKFTTAALDFGPLVKAIGANPVMSFDTFFKDVTSDYDIYQHVVGRSIFTKANSASPVVVSLYSNCEVIAAGSHGFGANFGVYVTGPGTGIVAEFDSHVTHASGISSALVVDSIGSYPSVQAMIVQPNGPSSPFNYGINFNNAAGNNAIVHEAVRFTGAGSAERFLYAGTDMLFTAAEIELPSFIVGPTVAEVGTNAKIRIDANASGSPLISAVGSAASAAIRYRTKSTADHIFQGGDGLSRLVVKGTVGATYLELAAGSGGAVITARGTDTNADVILTGKGSAGVNFLAGDGTSKIRANTTGVGLNGATPVGKSTLPAALSTGGAETNTNICTMVNSLRTTLINLGASQ